MAVLLWRCEKVGGSILQMHVLMGITGKQNSDKVTGIAEVFGRRLGSSLLLEQC